MKRISLLSMIKRLFDRQKEASDTVIKKGGKERDIEEFNDRMKATFAFGFYNNHVVRSPIVRILGLINLALLEQNHSPQETREILLKIKECAQELDDKTRKHNDRIIDSNNL